MKLNPYFINIENNRKIRNCLKNMKCQMKYIDYNYLINYDAHAVMVLHEIESEIAKIETILDKIAKGEQHD